MESSGSTKVLITDSAIKSKLKELASTVAAEYKDKNLVLLVVLKGAYIFAADFSRALWQAGKKDFEVDFIGVTSYGSETSSSRDPKITTENSIAVFDKDILIVEDIIETGHSLLFLHETLAKKNPKSLKSLVLLSKRGKKEAAITPGYIGFEIDGNVWIEGYGLDSNQKSRGAPDILAKKD